MATRTQSPHAASLTTQRSHEYESMGGRIVPVPGSAPPAIAMSDSHDPSAGEPMDISSPAKVSVASDTEPNGKSTDRSKNSSPPDQGAASNMPAPPPAAAAVHQPKIVQTAFIHKLYK